MDGFITTFIELYNIVAAFFLIFMIGQILIMLKHMDRDMVKASVFLREEILEKTWMFIAIAGASFALHAVTQFIKTQQFINTYFLNELTQILFLFAFILAVYQWYAFISGLSKNSKKGSK